MTEENKEVECVFCKKFENEKPDINVIDFEPLNPVIKGHRLVVPREHVADFASDVDVTTKTMRYASYLTNSYLNSHESKYPSFNIITSKGREATQSVFHFHVHIVPRQKDDGLKLPWTDQKTNPKEK